jgi:hypothetical protein
LLLGFGVCGADGVTSAPAQTGQWLRRGPGAADLAGQVQGLLVA